MTTNIKKLLITFAVGVAFTVVIWITSGLFKVTNYADLAGKISDGLFFAGVLIAGAGGLVLSYNEGATDGLTYSLHSAFGFRDARKDGRPQKESYYEYHQRKHKNKKPFAHLVIVGLSFVAVAVIFFVISVSIG